MQHLPSFGVIAGALFVAYVLGAIVWGLCWAVIRTFLGKRPRLTEWLGGWRLMRWIAAVSVVPIAPDQSALFFERAHDRGLPWRERLGWKRVARQTLCFTAAGFLILSAVYLFGAYERSVQWYEIEPPPDISGSLAGDVRPDSSAWLTDWTVTGVFWTKDACLQHIRLEAETDANLLLDRTRSSTWYRAFAAARRCIAANTPHAPAPEPDSDGESSEDPGD